MSEGVQEEIIEGEPTPAHDVFFLEWARGELQAEPAFRQRTAC